jgi:hypothetical protein
MSAVELRYDPAKFSAAWTARQVQVRTLSAQPPQSFAKARVAAAGGRCAM